MLIHWRSTAQCKCIKVLEISALGELDINNWFYMSSHSRYSATSGISGIVFPVCCPTQLDSQFTGKKLHPVTHQLLYEQRLLLDCSYQT